MSICDESNDPFAFCRHRYRLPPARIAMLRFLVEGYDGLLFLRTIEARIAVVELSWSKSCAADAEGILEALSTDLGMVTEEMFTAFPK